MHSHPPPTPTNLPLLAVLACMQAETGVLPGRPSPHDLATTGHRAVRKLPRLRLADLTSRRQANDPQSAPHLIGLTARCLVGLPHDPIAHVPYDMAAGMRADSRFAPLNAAVADECIDVLNPDQLRPYSYATSQWRGAHTPGGFLDMGRAVYSVDQASLSDRVRSGSVNFDGRVSLPQALALMWPRADWWDGTVAERLGSSLTAASYAVMRYRRMQAEGRANSVMLAPGELDGIPQQCVIWHVAGRPGRVPARNRHTPGTEDAVAIVINNTATHPYEVLDVEESFKLTAATMFIGEFTALCQEQDGAHDWANKFAAEPPHDVGQRFEQYKADVAARALGLQQRAAQVLERLQHWLDGRGHWPTEPEAQEELEARLRHNAVARGYKVHEAAELRADEVTKLGRPSSAPAAPPAPRPPPTPKPAPPPAVKKDELRAQLAAAAADRDASQARNAAALALIKGDHDMLEPDNLMRPILAEYMAALVGAVPAAPDVPTT